MTRTTLLTLAFVLAAGCPPAPTVCDAMAAASVNLHLADPDGGGVMTAQVSYTVDGGAPAMCEPLNSGDYVCGWEIGGVFDVSIGAEGYLADSFSVTVEDGECHVVPQVVNRTLVPNESVCTEDLVAAVLVNLTDSQGAEVTVATVSWGLPNVDGMPQICDPVAGNQWACGPQFYGVMEIRITDAGPYEPFNQAVAVPYDGCHPVTQTLDAVLAYLPD